MNNRMTCRRLILAAVAGCAAAAFSQGGPLTPPAGAPAPTMKTLDQVEPRIPLVAGAPGVTVAASGQITISQPGSYYLTGNVEIASGVDGIRIAASGVTVDLMGYSIIYNGTGTAWYAILIWGNQVTVQNGHILSTTTHNGSSFVLGGFLTGVHSDEDYENVTVRNLSVRGVRSNGISVEGNSCQVENCTVAIAALNGIQNANGIVRNAAVHNCGNIGITAASALNCKVIAAVGAGISAEIVENCSAASTGSMASGIAASVVTNSVGSTSGYHGISASTVRSSSGASVGANGETSCGIYGETVSDSVGYASKATGGGHGIAAANSVTGSYGASVNTASDRHGIYVPGGTVTSSRGAAAGGHGIFARTVSSSSGTTAGTHGTNSSGIYGSNRVDNSSGYALVAGGGHGIRAALVSNSYGYADTDALNGIDATLVTHSYGARGAIDPALGQFGITAYRGVGCYATQGDGIIQRYDMP